MSEMVVQLSAEQLRDLVRAVVREEVARNAALPPKEVLNLKELCDLLDRTRHTVARLIADEGLPSHAISDREPRFIRSEVLEWLRNRPAHALKPEAA